MGLCEYCWCPFIWRCSALEASCKTASSVQRQDKPFSQLVQQSSQPRQYACVLLSKAALGRVLAVTGEVSWVATGWNRKHSSL